MRIAVVVFFATVVLSPRALTAGEVYLHFRDLQQAPSGQWIADGFRLPPQDRSLPIIAETSDGPVAALLRSLDGRGVANGFEGILYDNRDRGHSALPMELFPRLHHLKYGVELQADDADYGLAGAIRHNAIVFGNSSTAITGGPIARSQTRLSMTLPGSANQSASLYQHNHIYIYPEHRDYDEIDRYSARWPYHIISQGSSGSDRPFLRAVATTLAAFRQDTLSFMKENGLVAPTIEMVLRRNLKHVVTAQDYFDGAAHRPVLQKDQLRPIRMVEHAARLAPEDIPPVVRLRVIEEDFSDTAGLVGLDERLFDTPSAIARIWRGFSRTKSILVSAESTEDPNGLPLSFSWHILQGDLGRVRLEPVDVKGRVARISVDWHEPFSIPASGEADLKARQSARVDIGVFASNGRSVSSPAIVSIAFPTHQQRSYTQDATHGWRIESIDYDAQARDEYYDPLLYWSANWSDRAMYDASGALIGWHRRYTGETDEQTILSADAPYEAYSLDNSQGRPVLKFTK